MSNLDIRQTFDPLLNQLEKERSIDVAEKIIAELVRLLGVNVSDRFLLNVPRIDAELSRFMLAPGFGRQAAAYDIPNDRPELIDLKLFWIKKTTKTNLSWLIGITPNFEDSEANDYKNISIDFIFPESADRLIILISDKFKIRSLELKDHITHTQYEIFSNWKGVNIDQHKDSYTAKQLVHSKLWESFNFEPINRAFYLELVESFSLLVHHLEKSFSRKPAVMFTTRLIGRLLFLWFLKKKNYINKEPGYFDVSNSNNQVEYYKSKLEVLFFKVLNLEIVDRDNGDLVTPYLNGGLFDVNQTDFYKDSKLTFPAGYFSSLFATLNKYNFTVDESSPEFQHVAIDPEMLGRIFESLLTEQIDEVSGSNKKKVTGAFYTPREIVSFMCEESLIEFLKDKIPESADRDLRLQELIRLPETIFRDQDQNKRQVWKPYAESIINALSGSRTSSPLTVLDPAVGSGAFPMGMLHLLVKVFSRLDTKYEKNISKLKRDILSKSLYGADIEQTAIEICRLRAWLSIIVDIPEGDVVAPLPNLDFKFTCANTLIPLEDNAQGSLLDDYQLKDKLMVLRDDYFSTSNKNSKQKIQKNYDQLTHSQDLFDTKRTKQLKSYKPFDVSSSSDFYDPDLHHGLQQFDIVIGNPPYVQLQKFSNQKFQKELSEVGFSTFAKTGDLYCLFYEQGLNFLKPHGILTFITSNKWMKASYGEKLRELFLKNNPKMLLNLGSNVFETATVDTNIILLKKEKYQNESIGVNYDISEPGQQQIEKYVSLNAHQLRNLTKNPWSIGNDQEQNLKTKIENTGKKLKDLQLKVYIGIKSGLSEAFIVNDETKDALVSKDPNSSRIIKPLIRGRDISQYTYKFPNLYLLMTGFDLDIPKKYPAVFSHLKTFKDKASVRGDKGLNWYNLRACAYYSEFEKEKIVWSDISTEPSFTFLPNGYYINNTAYMITGKENLRFILAVLNSKVIKWFFPLIATDLGASGLRYFKNFVEQLPIPDIFSIPKEISLKVDELVDAISRSKLVSPEKNTKEILLELDKLIYRLYNLTDDEIKIIESC